MPYHRPPFSESSCLRLLDYSLLDMYDVTNNDHNQPRQVEMPLISIPTETVRTNVVRPDEGPPSTTEASQYGTSGFDVGIDTCGFTIESTVTCDFGYDCTNVGGHRGCCVAGAADCVATIYTECINHDKTPTSDGCGQHTLCCPGSKPYCFVYAYLSTSSTTEATLTYFECNESQGFGEMYPFPPELMTETANSSTTETGSGSDSPSLDSPANSPEHSSSRSSRNAGAIIGGVVGGVVFIILIILSAFLLLRYRRRRHQAKLRASIIPLGPAKTPHSSTDTPPEAEKDQDQDQVPAETITATQPKSKPVPILTPTPPKTARQKLFRPLSSIHEHPTPTPSSTLSRNKSTSSAMPSSASRGSFGPNWPLGPGPNSNPLSSHPVDANLKKRLSDSRLGTLSLAQALAVGPDMGAGIGMGMGVGREMGVGNGRVRPLNLSRTPPPGSRPAPPKSPRGAGLAVQSPRLEFVPVSPIVGRITDSGVGDRDEEVDPVSPIESDDEGGGEDTQRLSYVSAPSAHFEGDDFVSPVSPRVVWDGDGDVSPRTVSPLGSQRGSVAS
ncbi:uncharacterized protein GGS22DRAFT_4257 [Annulohypoxylon maeteangense]|uniref:uncharacterized protein n=1 Tax=Annulohypoxylon maeteangense TaxID=1927788 RepID=UPI0020082294|nr:uncharacterized protein GGS22DRAFT_4257 [Annulohypoxylon maeteangense]KAI0889810.1 hypothetical protein GGS22DRAFT_4257 [Annulohypoxylon maeteangense]